MALHGYRQGHQIKPAISTQINFHNSGAQFSLQFPVFPYRKARPLLMAIRLDEPQ